jgi:ADP-ribose pyrophosphatase YjhB (NUDIX family)
MENVFCLNSNPQVYKNWSIWQPSLQIPKEIPEAAGVLPFTFFQGQLLVLLGRESHRPGFQDGGLYADFGGGVSNKGKTSVECATKELQEETFKTLMDEPLEVLTDFVKKNTCLIVSSNFGKKTPYHLYCVYFPYIEVENLFSRRIDAAKKYKTMTNDCFEKERLALKNAVPEAFQLNGRIRKSWVEKSEIRWFTIKNVNKLPLREEFSKTLDYFKVFDRLFTFLTGAPLRALHDQGDVVRSPPLT